MTARAPQDLILALLQRGLLGVTGEYGAVLAQAAAVCFEAQQHRSGVELTVDGSFSASYRVLWQDVTDQMRRCWNDLPYAAEHGAYGVAFLLILDLTEWTVLEKSCKGPGFDYRLGKKEDGEQPPFQNTARLEVSGILKGNDGSVAARVRRKLDQVRPSDDTQTPAYIIVVEFGTPLSRVVAR